MHAFPLSMSQSRAVLEVNASLVLSCQGMHMCAECQCTCIVTLRDTADRGGYKFAVTSLFIFRQGTKIPQIFNNWSLRPLRIVRASTCCCLICVCVCVEMWVCVRALLYLHRSCVHTHKTTMMFRSSECKYFGYRNSGRGGQKIHHLQGVCVVRARVLRVGGIARRAALVRLRNVHVMWEGDAPYDECRNLAMCLQTQTMCLNRYLE